MQCEHGRLTSHIWIFPTGQAHVCDGPGGLGPTPPFTEIAGTSGIWTQPSLWDDLDSGSAPEEVR